MNPAIILVDDEAADAPCGRIDLPAGTNGVMRKEHQAPPLLARVLRSTLMVSLAIGALSTR
jgi:hypothetical protein